MTFNDFVFLEEICPFQQKNLKSDDSFSGYHKLYLERPGWVNWPNVIFHRAHLKQVRVIWPRSGSIDPSLGQLTLMGKTIGSIDPTHGSIDPYGKLTLGQLTHLGRSWYQKFPAFLVLTISSVGRYLSVYLQSVTSREKRCEFENCIFVQKDQATHASVTQSHTLASVGCSKVFEVWKARV